jgi:hypothetical protein
MLQLVPLQDGAATKGPENKKQRTARKLLGVGDIPGDLKVNFEEFQLALRWGAAG